MESFIAQILRCFATVDLKCFKVLRSASMCCLSRNGYLISPSTSLGQQSLHLWVGNGPKVRHLCSSLSHRRKAINQFVGPLCSCGQEPLRFGQKLLHTGNGQKLRNHLLELLLIILIAVCLIGLEWVVILLILWLLELLVL